MADSADYATQDSSEGSASTQLERESSSTSSKKDERDNASSSVTKHTGDGATSDRVLNNAGTRNIWQWGSSFRLAYTSHRLERDGTDSRGSG